MTNEEKYQRLMVPHGAIEYLLGFDRDGSDVEGAMVRVYANELPSRNYPEGRVKLEIWLSQKDGSLACLTSSQARRLATMLGAAADAADAACPEHATEADGG